MNQRLKGLQHECDLLAAEIARYESGELHEHGSGPDGSRIDITDLWLAHLKALLAVKRWLRKKLFERSTLAAVAEERGPGL
jgi:hypothetical protein